MVPSLRPGLSNEEVGSRHPSTQNFHATALWVQGYFVVCLMARHLEFCF